MYKNLKVSSLKGLKECLLVGLGKINVVCGKNNSGKSTLLEAVNEQRVPIKIFEENDIDELYRMTVDQMQFGGKTSPLAGPYHDLLKRLFLTSRVWHTEELSSFVSLVSSEFTRNQPFQRHQFDNRGLAAAYPQMFLGQEETVLLPPKRQLELSVGIKGDQPISPNGSGILNYLFYARNQIESSSDREVYSQIARAFTAISSGYSFDILMEKSNVLTLRFSYDDRPWIDAQFCGLGLQDLLVILYFSVHPQYPVVLIEEPESHIHPDMQRKLLYFLKEETSKQFFLTTHSNVFLNNVLVDKVYFTHFEDAIKVDDATGRSAILNDLGYAVTDNLVSDLIILVEGPKDTPIIEELLVKFGLFGTYDIKVWPLGGDIMDQVDLSVFAQHYSIIALIDNDPGSEPIRKKFIRNCEKYSIPVKQLERYAIENYFSLKALREVFKGQIPDVLTSLDPHTKLEDQIGMNVKKCNRKIISKMDLSEIENTDLYDFFEQVKNMCVK